MYHHDWRSGESYKRFRVKERVEGILWWLGFRAFIAESSGSIPAGGTKILQAEWSPTHTSKKRWWLGYSDLL